MIKYTKNFILRGASENSVIARIMIVVGSLLLLSSSLLLLLFNNINNISMYIDMLMSNILAVTLFSIKFALGNYLFISSLLLFSFIFCFYKNYKKDDDKKLYLSIKTISTISFVFLIYSIIHKIIVKETFLDSQYHFLTYFFSTLYISMLFLIILYALNSFSNRDIIIDLKSNKKLTAIFLSFILFFMLLETFFIENMYLTLFFSAILAAILLITTIVKSDELKTFVSDRANILFKRNPNLKKKLNIDYGKINKYNLFVTKFDEIFTQLENNHINKKDDCGPVLQVFFNEISNYNKMNDKDVTINFDGKILKEILVQHNIEDDDIFMLYLRENGLYVLNFDGDHIYTFCSPKSNPSS
jgi:hypothetical protein